MNDDAIIRSMRSTSDEELLAITSGTAMGYTDQARAIAEAVLRERRVRLPPDLKELRKRGAIAEAEANRISSELDAAGDRALGRKFGIKLILLGFGSFVLPILDQLKPLGWAIRFAALIIVIAGCILAVQTNSDASQTPPTDDS